MPSDETSLSKKDIMQLFAAQSEETRRTLIEAITLLKKPTELEQQKLDADAANSKRRLEGRVAMAKAEEQAKAMRAQFCVGEPGGVPHMTKHPSGALKTAFRAQVHTPNGEKPYFVPTCQKCGYQVGKIVAPTYMLTNGVNMHEMSVNLEQLERWASESNTALTA